jgi:hypothetical protein
MRRNELAAVTPGTMLNGELLARVEPSMPFFSCRERKASADTTA